MVVRPPIRVSVLNERHVAGIIQLLHERGELNGSELKAVTGNYEIIKKIMKKLEGDGLVTTSIDEKPRLTFRYSLTEKGIAVAELIDEIDHIVDS